MDVKDVLRAERAALCDTLERLGPGAPTLCEGWTTADLAAHLVVRERDPRSGPGIMVGGALGRYTEKLMAREKAKGYPELIARLRSGPPAIVFALMPGLNVSENWIHHEDARRANGEEPRPPDGDVDAVLTRVMARMGRVQTRAMKPYGVVLAFPDGSRLTVRAADPSVIVRGPIGECVLYLSGRRGAARVELEGDADALARLRAAKLGI
ncbi:MAG TPA: TIGR03085 family metal-binding protein [Acidimicrobiia bacterium]|nr:TIGR03085 family metal-binding protein [Acidimicrobiia bacterium]